MKSLKTASCETSLFRRFRRWLSFPLLGSLFLFFLASGCSTTIPKRDNYLLTVRRGFTDESSTPGTGINAGLYTDRDPIFETEWLDFGVEASVLRYEDGIEPGFDASLIPKLRYKPFDENTVYVKGGVGGTYSEVADESDYSLGGHLFFAEEIGAGYIANINGENLEFGYTFRHISNAGLADENRGLNTHILEFGISW